MAKITYTDKETLNEIPSIPAKNKVQAADMNEIKNVVNQNELKILLIADSSAPAECSTGDMYYNTTTKLIYTATGTNTWGSTGVNPTQNTLYIDSTNKSTYFYDGSDLISVGGGAGGESLKIGTIVPFAGSTIPDGYLTCDGTAVSRTTYSDLFAVIGTTYGSGDGSTTFNLPNIKGKVLVGLDSDDTDFDTIGKTFGEKKHTLTIAEMPSHKHNLFWGITEGGTSNSIKMGVNYAGLTPGQMESTGGGQAHNNLQPYIVTNFIIKASKKVALDKGNVVDSLDGSDTDSAPSVRAVNEALVETYSTDEVKTNKVWIDGKPIYRKVITGTTSNEISGGTEIETQIMTGVSNIVYAGGYVETSSSLKFLISSSWDLRVILVGNIVRLDGKDTNQYRNKPYKLILEYTKTTD